MEWDETTCPFLALSLFLSVLPTLGQCQNSGVVRRDGNPSWSEFPTPTRPCTRIPHTCARAARARVSMCTCTRTYIHICRNVTACISARARSQTRESVCCCCTNASPAMRVRWTSIPLLTYDCYGENSRTRYPSYIDVSKRITHVCAEVCY